MDWQHLSSSWCVLLYDKNSFWILKNYISCSASIEFARLLKSGQSGLLNYWKVKEYHGGISSIRYEGGVQKRAKRFFFNLTISSTEMCNGCMHRLFAAHVSYKGVIILYWLVRQPLRAACMMIILRWSVSKGLVFRDMLGSSFRLRIHANVTESLHIILQFEFTSILDKPAQKGDEGKVNTCNLPCKLKHFFCFSSQPPLIRRIHFIAGYWNMICTDPIIRTKPWNFYAF